MGFSLLPPASLLKKIHPRYPPPGGRGNRHTPCWPTPVSPPLHDSEQSGLSLRPPPPGPPRYFTLSPELALHLLLFLPLPPHARRRRLGVWTGLR